MEHKGIQLEFKASENGTVEGYASRFNEVDQGNDTVVKGAFSGSIGRRKVKMLWQHNMAEPIGVWEAMSEDENGLYVKGRVLDEVAKGREALALVRAGAVDGLSIGYKAMDYSYDKDIRILKQVDLFEVSLVTFPMQETARIDAFKAAEMDIREFERRLTRDAKFSRSVAQALLSGGIDAVKTMRDAGDSGLYELAQFMRQNLKNGEK